MPKTAKEKLLELADKLPVPDWQRAAAKQSISQLDETEAAEALDFLTDGLRQQIDDLKAIKPRLPVDKQQQCQELIDQIENALKD